MRFLNFSVEVDTDWVDGSSVRTAVLKANNTEVWRSDGEADYIPYQYEEEAAEQLVVEMLKKVFNG